MGQILLTFLFFPLFFLACIFIFTIPGYFLLSILGYKKEKGDYILATALGISLFLLLIYSFSWLNLPYVPLFIVAFINIYYFWNNRKQLLQRPKISDPTSFGIIVFGSLAFVGLTWFSGWEIFGSTNFYGVNAEDGLIHLSRIHNLLYTFPPTHPGLTGVPFNGYHYFYDLLLSRFVLFFQFNPSDLYFRYFSLFIAVFYGLSILYFSKRFTTNPITLRFILIFAYFSTGFAFFLSFFHLQYSSNFAQPLILIFDPSVLLSVAILCIAFSILPTIRKSYKNMIVVGLLFGILCQLKVYAGLLGISVLVFYSLYSFIKYGKKIFPIFALTNIVVCLLTIITFFPNNLGSGGLIFNPLIFYSNYMQQPFFDFLQWENKRLIFAQFNNYPRIAFLYLQAFVIFWFLTLGVRSIFLLDARNFFLKTFWQKDYHFMVVVIVVVSLIIGSFFIQSISVFDIMQFLWIAMIFLSIPSGITLARLLSQRKVLAYGFIFLFVITSCWLLYKEYMYAYSQPKPAYQISSQERIVYQKAQRVVPVNGFITVLPQRSFSENGDAVLGMYPPSLVSAMTGRNTYYENEKIEYNLDRIYKERKGALFAMHEALDICNQQKFAQLVKRTGSPYLVVQFDSPCLATHSALLEIAASEKAVFYQLQEK